MAIVVPVVTVFENQVPGGIEMGARVPFLSTTFVVIFLMQFWCRSKLFLHNCILFIFFPVDLIHAMF